MRSALVVSGVALAVIGAVSPALARERLAVLISVEGDRELADNLCEVVIAKLSSAAEHELVGQAELSERLLELRAFADGGLPKCVEEPGCLAGVGVVADAKLAVIGRVERHDQRFFVEFSLVEIETGFRRAIVSESSADDTAHLIATVQDGVALLFDEGSERAKPPTREALAGLPVSQPVERGLSSDLKTSTAGALAAAGATLSLAAALVTGKIARKRLFLAAATFGVAAGIAYFWR